MRSIRSGLAAALVATGLLAAGSAALAQASSIQVPAAVDAQLRKVLPERLPDIGKVDEVLRTPMPGVYEVRVGTELFYSDAEGNYLMHGGQLLDTRARKNLTEERMDKLLAIDVKSLPLKDAFKMVRGNGKRQLVVFEDPNCGYCKRFERDLQKVDNVTVYLFLYPILGRDSAVKSRNIWCSADRGKAWTDYMVRDQAVPAAEGNCDISALQRNLELGRKYKITGTPTLVFADGSRVPGAISAADVEKLLASK